MDATERALLDRTVRDAIAGAPDAADTVLVDLGWYEMLASEPRDAIAAVFGALGASNVSASVLDDVVVAGLGREPRADLAVLLPVFGAWDPPGAGGPGLATERITTATELLVVGPTGCVTIPMGAATITPVRGIDPDARLHTVDITHATVAAESLDGSAWEMAVALARRALAHEIAGASRTMLNLARTHAVERVQFGRPIARFQAVRHRLADALVAVDALDAAIEAADDEPNATTAALAKALAGRTARTVAAHCQQVLAGIGFTTDHPFHRYLKRTMVLDGIFGTTDAIALELGRSLLAGRTVPTLIEL